MYIKDFSTQLRVYNNNQYLIFKLFIFISIEQEQFMKKFILFTSVLTLSTISFANGGFQSQPQNVISQNMAIKDVNSALNAKDNTPVTLVGSIIKQIDDDEYLFKDNSGTIQIEVDKKAWNGQTITPQDTIEIRGKIDKDRSKIEIEVYQVIKK